MLCLDRGRARLRADDAPGATTWLCRALACDGHCVEVRWVCANPTRGALMDEARAGIQ